MAVKYANWDAAYDALCGALRRQQPDGLLGFSQGATAAALFLASLLAAQVCVRARCWRRACAVSSAATGAACWHVATHTHTHTPPRCHMPSLCAPPCHAMPQREGRDLDVPMPQFAILVSAY
jgi:hypothetical protein